MKHIYFNLETSAVIQLFVPPNEEDTEQQEKRFAGQKHALISSVGVLTRNRGKGYASRLMREEVLRDADEEGVVLILGVEAQDPEEGMTDEELRKWYVRCGFREEEENFWVRQPEVPT